MQAGVTDDAIRKLLHLSKEEFVPFVHVIEEGSEIGAADLIEPHFIGHANKMLAIDVDLKPCRFPNVNMCVNNHYGMVSGPIGCARELEVQAAGSAGSDDI